MTNDIRNVLATCVADPPDDLVALYSSPLPANPELGIKILALGDAIKYSRAIHERTLLGKSMGLFVLDDANDSNPFCYVTRGPAKSCILHLYHDGDTAIEYSSLAAFLTALEPLSTRVCSSTICLAKIADRKSIRTACATIFPN
jgi:hypothetical protein